MAGMSDLRQHSRLRHRLRVAEAMILLMLCAIMVRLLPFRLYATILGQPSHPNRAPDHAMDQGDLASALAVKAALAAAARRLPWASTCLMRTFAARLMLARRGIGSIAWIGVSGPLTHDDPHAWLSIGEHDLTGGAKPAAQIPLAVFIAEGRTRR
jgi:hypothetical protein